MHAENVAENVVAESLVAEIEGLNEASLPVPLPVAGAEAALAAVDEARSEDVRGLLAAIQRLMSVVEEETIALETGKKIDFDDFSTRKSRSMLEFVRLMRARIHLGGEAQVIEEIQKLRQKLERNRAVLERHYEAVREVAAVIVKAMRDAESDGTYSANAAQGGK
jgi:flagellar biosynthesis/type III secretory pathway chaperone